MIVTTLVSTCVEAIVIVTGATGSATKFPSLSEKPDPEEQHSSTPDSGPTPQQKSPPPQGIIGSKAFVLPYNSTVSLWRSKLWSLKFENSLSLQ
jgi:hypothetical protein